MPGFDDKAEAAKGKKNRANGARFKDALRRALARAPGANGKYSNGLNLVADQLVLAALAGEQWAIKEVADRIDGKPKQQIEATGKDGKDLNPGVMVVPIASSADEWEQMVSKQQAQLKREVRH